MLYWPFLVATGDHNKNTKKKKNGHKKKRKNRIDSFERFVEYTIMRPWRDPII